MNCGDLPDTLEYTVIWVNNGPSAANGVSISDFLIEMLYIWHWKCILCVSYDIFDEVWTASSGTSINRYIV
ncbi:MAG: DUF11 domain-containing protein [Bacteroidetes bacterium]|nr:DUF11 domain-containing protein [Bacteroidota bacterium]